MIRLAKPILRSLSWRVPKHVPLIAVGLLLVACGLGRSAFAQQPPGGTPEDPQYLDFDSGDLKFRTHSYASLIGQTVPAMYFVPDQGLTADMYVATADLKPGWVQLVNKFGWNGFATDWVGCGRTIPPPKDDLVILTDKAIYGVFQMGVASAADLVVARGLGSAFVIKAHAMDERFDAPAVLIDPIGPKGAQPMPNLTVEELLARRDHYQDELWVDWGLGPKPGKMYDETDLTEEDFQRLLERYETDQPSYWATVFTGFDGGLEVREPMRIQDWPVLIVRTPHRSKEEIAREDAVAQWLQDRGAKVDRLDLGDLNLPGVGGLPMCGKYAEQVLAQLVDWVTRTAPPAPRS